MDKLALLATFQAKPGKETEVENFLKAGLTLVEEEPQTNHWFALNLGNGKYGIFDTFEKEEGRDAHLNGKVAEALMAKAPELFSAGPMIEKVELIAVKEPVRV